MTTRSSSPAATRDSLLQPAVKVPAFDTLLPLLLAGYLLGGRAFAWLHIPGTPIFVGEIVLAFGLAGALRTLTWNPVWRHSSVPLLMALYVGWGFALFLPGFLDDPIFALRDGAIWIYCIVTWAVLAVLVARPQVLSKWLGRYLSLIPYAVVWLPVTVILHSLDVGTVPDSNVSLTSFDNGLGQVHLLMILAFIWLVWNPVSASHLRSRLWVSGVGLVGLLAMGTRNRGGFVAAMLGLVLLLVLHPSRSRLVVNGGRILLVATILFVAVDPKIALDEREISTEQLASNITSLVTRENDRAGLGGNISWRLSHWGTILEGVNRDVPLTGHGFGPNIAEIYFIPQTDIGLRNAHNSHLTIMARSGWVGLGLWIALWGVWYHEVNRARRRLRGAGLDRLSGLAAWGMVGITGYHVEAIFNPSIEGPQASFWLWSICALGVFLVVLSRVRRISGAGPGSADGYSTTEPTFDVDGLEDALDRMTWRSRRA